MRRWGAIARGTSRGRRMGRAGARRNPNLFADGDMEQTTVVEWTGSSSTLTKSTASPNTGLRALRVTNTSTNGYAVNSGLVAPGSTYRITGWGRGNGVATPQLYVSGVGICWVGTTSTDWQYFDCTVAVAASNQVRCYCVGGAGNWSEWDDLYLSLVS